MTHSVVATIFRIRYDENLKQSPSWNNAAVSIRAHIRQHYLYDQLRRYWRGTGDTKSYLFVSSAEILNAVNPSSLAAALDAWFEESLRSRPKESIIVQRAIVKAICGSRVKTFPDNGKKYVSGLLYSPEELKGSGIVPQNIANTFLTHPDDGRKVDPASLGAKRNAYVEPSDFESIFRDRFAQIKARLMAVLYDESLLEIED